MIADAAARRPAVLIVFDLLRINGDDLRSLPLFERRRALHAHVEPVRGIQIIEHVETYGEALFHAIVDGDHEGIVAKRADAPYRAGPSRAWLKQGQPMALRDEDPCGHGPARVGAQPGDGSGVAR